MSEFPNWFEMTPAKKNFEDYLSHMAGQPDLKFLQLGVYTGDATKWLMENVLTDSSSYLVDVDTWQGSDEEDHHAMNFVDVEKEYDSKIKDLKNVIKVKATTTRFLKETKMDFYDFIYIDADHTALGVFLDAELSWLCLKSEGILAFDDYEWSQGKGEMFDPKPGINSFLERHKGEWLPIQKNWQLWIQKI